MEATVNAAVQELTKALMLFTGVLICILVDMQKFHQLKNV